MGTFTFTKTNGLIAITVSGGAASIPTVRLKPLSSLKEIRKSLTAGYVVVDFDGVEDYNIRPAVDTVILGVTTYEPASNTVDQMIALFKASTVFPDPNSGAGGTGTLDQVLAAGSTLTENRTVDLNGKDLIFSVGGTQVFNIKPGDGAVSLTSLLDKRISVSDDSGSVLIQYDDNTKIISTAGLHTITGNIISATLLAASHANDITAAAGGIAVGGLYHTGGVVKIRLT